MGKRFEETDIKMNNFVMFYDHETKTLRHLSKKAVIDLLNEQDEKIKELESQVAKWKQDYENCSKLEKNMSKEHQYCLDNWRGSEEENKQLKQSQNSKAIEVLERAKIEFETYYADNIWNYPDWIDNQITELRN